MRNGLRNTQRIVYTVGLEPELDFRYNNIFILFININKKFYHKLFNFYFSTNQKLIRRLETFSKKLTFMTFTIQFLKLYRTLDVTLVKKTLDVTLTTKIIKNNSRALLELTVSKF